ncbi:MAG TPA: MFS transporter [Candidatus Baltobacteraceae bacterium]|jgi:DHA1 family tetracycline resistance protein-like MFS transporter
MIRRLIPILGITFIDILGFSMLIPMLPYFVTHFHASAIMVGVLFSTFSFCQLLAGPVWGNVSDRIGRKAVLIISQVGATIGWAMLAFAPDLTWVFIARIVEGISGGNIGITQAYVADLVAPKDRSRAFGLIGAMFGAGMIFGPLGGGFLFAHYGFAVPFLVASGLQFITLVLTIVLLPESRTKEQEAQSQVRLRDIGQTFSDPHLARILYQKLALSLGLYAWFSVMALYLKQQLHFGLAQTDYFFSLVSVLGVGINIFVVSRVSERVGDRNMSSLGLVSLLAAFLLVAEVHGLVLLAIMAPLFSIGMAFANTGITALISNAAADNRQGTVLGVSSSLDSFAGIVSPLASTGLLTKYGSPYAGVTSAVLSAIALAMGLAATRSEERSAIAVGAGMPGCDPVQSATASAAAAEAEL